MKRKRRSQKRFTEDDDNELLVVLKQLYQKYDSKRLTANWREVQTALNKRLKNGKQFDIYQVNQHWLRVLAKKVDGSFNWKSAKKKRKVMEKREEREFLKEEENEDISMNHEEPAIAPFSMYVDEGLEERKDQVNIDFPMMWKPRNTSLNYFKKYFEFDLVTYVANSDIEFPVELLTKQ